MSPGLNVSLRPVRRGILLWMELFLAVEEEEEEEEVCDELSFLGIVERVGVELICKTHTPRFNFWSSLLLDAWNISKATQATKSDDE